MARIRSRSGKARFAARELLAGIPVAAKSLSVGPAIYGSSDSPDVKYAEMKSPEAMKDVLLVLHLAFQCFPPLHSGHGRSTAASYIAIARTFAAYRQPKNATAD
jgi:hypothetical protein